VQASAQQVTGAQGLTGQIGQIVPTHYVRYIAPVINIGDAFATAAAAAPSASASGPDPTLSPFSPGAVPAGGLDAAARDARRAIERLATSRGGSRKAAHFSRELSANLYRQAGSGASPASALAAGAEDGAVRRFVSAHPIMVSSPSLAGGAGGAGAIPSPARGTYSGGVVDPAAAAAALAGTIAGTGAGIIGGRLYEFGPRGAMDRERPVTVMSFTELGGALATAHGGRGRRGGDGSGLASGRLAGLRSPDLFPAAPSPARGHSSHGTGGPNARTPAKHDNPASDGMGSLSPGSDSLTPTHGAGASQIPVILTSDASLGLSPGAAPGTQTLAEHFASQPWGRQPLGPEFKSPAEDLGDAIIEDDDDDDSTADGLNALPVTRDVPIVVSGALLLSASSDSLDSLVRSSASNQPSGHSSPAGAHAPFVFPSAPLSPSGAQQPWDGGLSAVAVNPIRPMSRQPFASPLGSSFSATPAHAQRPSSSRGPALEEFSSLPTAQYPQLFGGDPDEGSPHELHTQGQSQSPSQTQGFVSHDFTPAPETAGAVHATKGSFSPNQGEADLEASHSRRHITLLESAGSEGAASALSLDSFGSFPGAAARGPLTAASQGPGTAGSTLIGDLPLPHESDANILEESQLDENFISLFANGRAVLTRTPSEIHRRPH
jgi:hypothetical protein